MLSGDRKGFTYFGEVMVKLLAILITVTLLFFLAGDSLIPIIDSLAQMLGLSPYETEALNTAAGVSYAMSCTSLIHSYHSVSDSVSDCQTEGGQMCNEIERMFNTGPATPDIPRSCAAATEGEGTKFGNVRVECDALSDFESMDSPADAGCDVYNFDLPQEFKGEGSVGDIATDWLFGNGHPKYLLYYNKYDDNYAHDWEYRMEKNSMILMGVNMVMSGFIAVVAWGFMGGPARAGKALSSSAGRQMMKLLGDAPGNILGGLRSTAQTLDSISPGLKSTITDELDRARLAVDSTVDSIRRGAITVPQILAKDVSEVRRVVHYSTFRESVARQLPEGASDDTIGTYTAVFYEGEGHLGDLIARDGTDVSASQIRNVMDNIQDGGPGIISGGFELSESQLDDIAQDMAESIRALDNGWQMAKAAGWSDDLYYKSVAHANSQGETLLRKAARDQMGEARLLFRDTMSRGWQGLRRMPEEAKERAFRRSGSTICGAKTSYLMAATLPMQDMVQSNVDQSEQEIRQQMSAAPSVAISASTAVEALRSGCGNGRNPFGALIAAGNIYTAYALAGWITALQAEVQMAIPKQPQGVNSIYLARPWFRPEEFGLNKYANWWYQNLDPGQEIEFASFTLNDPAGRRFMLASPCYASGSGSGGGSGGDSENQATLSFSRDSIASKLVPASGTWGYFGDGISKGQSRDNTCSWYSRSTRGGPVEYCQGKIRNCNVIPNEQFCADAGCVWNQSADKCITDPILEPEQIEETGDGIGPSCSGLSETQCTNPAVHESEYYGKDEFNESKLQNMGGSFLEDGKIVYAEFPIVSPEVNGETVPPGRTDVDIVNPEDASGINDPMSPPFNSEVMIQGASDGDKSFDQRGYWVRAGSDDGRAYVPSPTMGRVAREHGSSTGRAGRTSWATGSTNSVDCSTGSIRGEVVVPMTGMTYAHTSWMSSLQRCRTWTSADHRASPTTASAVSIMLRWPRRG